MKIYLNQMIKAYKKYKMIDRENEHYFEDKDIEINLLNNYYNY